MKIAALIPAVPSTLNVLLLALMLPAAVYGQATPAPVKNDTEEKKIPSDAVVLTPFEVSTNKDNGFAAAGSLAGGRLASDLRDTPAAYSVITREFIDALGITDLQAAAE